ncbi:MAG: hypothetical protein WA061_03105 [Microgenomates group bacterium]
MDIVSARKILGKTAEKMSDSEIQETIDTGNLLSDLILDMWLKLPKKEKDKFRNKN